MSDATPKQYNVTVIEVIAHSKLVTAANERDAHDIVRFHWHEVGDYGFDTRSLGPSEAFIVEEVRS
jgi:hypothetical protein